MAEKKKVNPETARERAIAKANAGLIPGTGMLDLTLPQNAASARLQAQANAYFAANPNLDPLTGQPRTVIGPTQPPVPGGSTGPTQPPVTRNSAYDLLLAEFTKYGLGSLVSDIRNFITNDTSPGELTLLIRNTDAYKKRFAGNVERLAKGLTALDEASYLAKEDAYQNIMRNYGLPDTYWKKDALGTQEGFTKLIANDVSAVELEDRIATAQNRVINANPQVKEALKKFYPNITDGDILAYSLDPQKALTDIKRKVTAAEIGGAALSQGLNATQLASEGLAAYGVTKQQAEQGYGQIADILPTAQKLASIYKEEPYTQQQAESEIFNLANSAEAAKKRRKLAQKEQATFSGSAGMSSGALSRDRALNNQGYGAGSY
jgi:hypothetical protein